MVQINMTKTIITRNDGQCQWPGCTEPSTQMATGDRFNRKDTNIGFFCAPHAYTIADYDSPEYHTTCPNCGCQFGVN